MKDADCGSIFCQRVFTGAKFTDDPGRCVTTKPIYRGRPLDVGAGAEVAVTDPTREPWHRRQHGSSFELELPEETRRTWAARLESAAFEEHASIAAFARTLCELAARGAPAWLVEATSRALSDEIRHAEESFAWAARLAVGRSPSPPGRLPGATAPFPDPASDAFVRDVVRGGCVGETLAVEAALTAASEAPERELAGFFRRIAEDEARHAALAFDTVRWLCGEDASLRTAVDDELRRFCEAASPAARALVTPLFETLRTS